MTNISQISTLQHDVDVTALVDRPTDFIVKEIRKLNIVGPQNDGHQISKI